LKLKAIMLALRASRRSEGIKLLESVGKSSPLSDAEQFILARAYFAEGLVEKYQTLMLKVLGAPLKNPQHLMHFIDFLIGRQELDRAELWLGELDRLAPQLPSAIFQKARILELRNRKPELLALLLERGRQFPDEIASMGALLERFGFGKEAEVAYKDFIARDPSQPERMLALAAFLARQDRPKEAVALLDQAWTTCRPEAVAGTALPLYIAPSADPEIRRRVESWIADAIQKSPGSADWLRTKLANIYCMQERYVEAEALYRQVLASDPENVETLSNLAWELALRDPAKSREALGLVDRAIKRAGRTSVLVNARAVALIRSGELERAASELRDAQAADPKNPSLALHLAWVYDEKGNVDEAQKAFAQAEEQGLKAQAASPLQRGIIERLRRKFATTPSSVSNSS
jgi:tetratricopeptide (TPR) repeat protein